MSLEKSVFDKDKMQTFLLQEYGFHLNEMRHLPMGTANCYEISCEEGKYFFKEYQKQFNIDDVKKETEVVEFLYSKGFPVARFIKTISGNSCFLFEGHAVCIQEYLEGESYLNDLPHELLKDSAKYLGILHSTLKDYPMETRLDEKWAESISVDSVNKKYDRLISALENEKSDPNYSRIKEDFLFKKELFGHIEEMKKYFSGITYTPSHGDYTACQLICDGDHVKAVIDFSSASKLPAIWEIMRSYIQSGACRDGQTFDIGDFAQYVKEYMKYAPLTKRDLEAMPYVYLFQLSRSGYGYEEYLIDKTENKDDLLKFALWRTDICREVYKNADAISEALLHLSENEQRYSCEEAYEMLTDKISKLLGDSWVYVKSNNAFKKKAGDFVTHLYIWRSHYNTSYEDIVFNCDVAFNYKKERIMFYQFKEKYHIESETIFNVSMLSLENYLRSDILPVVDELNSDIIAVMKKMTSKDNFWKYHVNPKYLIDILGKDALRDLAKEIIDSMSDGDKARVKDYLNGDTRALGEGSAYIAFCENGLFDELK